jgi:putative transposase
VAQRVEVVKAMVTPQRSVAQLLRFAGVPRSSWYYDKLTKPEDGRAANGRNPPGYTVNRDGALILDVSILSLLTGYRQQTEFQNACGYIKLTHYLRRDHGFYVNKKKLYRICRENGLLLPRKKKPKLPWRQICINRVITKPNELWEFDIKYGYVQGENRFFFILAFVDVFSRKVMGLYVGSRCQEGDLRNTLTEAIAKAGLPPDHELVIRSDNGPQMSAKAFYEHLKRLELKLSHEFIPPATPNKNAHVESFFSIIEIEFLQTRYFRTLAEAYSQTHEFIDFYNERRIHGSLKFRTPNEILHDHYLGKELLIKPVSL